MEQNCDCHDATLCVRATWVGRKYDKGIWRRITSSTASREAFLKERILNWRLEAPDDLQLVDGDQEEAPAALTNPGNQVL
jgi:hypothetical protein